MQQHDRVHLESQVERVTGTTVVRCQDEPAVRVDLHLAEEVDVGDQVTFSESVLAEFDQHGFAAADMAPVAVLLERRGAVPRLDQRRVGEAAERIVPAAGVGRDRAEDPSHVRIADAASRQVRRVLRLERVGHVVAFQRLLAAVEQRGDVRIRACSHEPQRGPASQDTRPVRAAWQLFFPYRIDCRHRRAPHRANLLHRNVPVGARAVPTNSSLPVIAGDRQAQSRAPQWGDRRCGALRHGARS